MTLDDILNSLRAAQFKTRVLKNGRFKPCPITWFVNNYGAKGNTLYDKCINLGFSPKDAYWLTDAVQNPDTLAVSLRITFEEFC